MKRQQNHIQLNETPHSRTGNNGTGNHGQFDTLD